MGPLPVPTLLALVLWLAAPAAASDRPTAKVVGGTEATRAWPFMAAIASAASPSLFSGQFCGGSLIAPKVVLTAAHCMAGRTPASIRVVVGRSLLSGSDGEELVPQSILMHPGYNASTLVNDIALIKLAAPAATAPVALVGSTETGLWATGQVSTVIGWGDTERPPPDRFPDMLREVDVPVVSDATCAGYYGAGLVTSVMVCAGLAEGGKDSCQGDSGGPLLVAGDDGFRQMGVVSWGDGCADPNAYGIYARIGVNPLRSWIVDNALADVTATVSGTVYDSGRLSAALTAQGADGTCDETADRDTSDAAAANCAAGKGAARADVALPGATVTLQRDGGGGSFADVPGATATTGADGTYTFGVTPAAGVFRVVVSRAGRSATSPVFEVPPLSRSIHIGIASDAAAADFGYAPAAPRAGEAVTFTASVSHPLGLGRIAGVAWDLDGDRAFDDASGATVGHTFASAGDQVVALRAADDDGDFTIVRRTVTVAAAPAPPPAPTPAPTPLPPAPPPVAPPAGFTGPADLLVPAAGAVRHVDAGGHFRVQIASRHGFALTGAVEVRLGDRRLTRRPLALAPQGAGTVLLRLPARERRRIKRDGRLTVSVWIVVRDPQGAQRRVRTALALRWP